VDFLCNVDIAPVLGAINKTPETYWRRQDQSKQNAYPVFHSTEHIVMRFVDSNDDPREFKSFTSWRLYCSVILPIMDQVSSYLKITNPVYPKAMFARLKARSRIDEHIDHGSSHKQVHKIHVPLTSLPDIHFKVNNETFYLQPGCAYEVNNLVKHGVDNPTDSDRIHFIFEVFDAGKNSGV